MMRRWDASVRRARRYAPARVARRSLYVPSAPLALVRARRGWTQRPAMVLHARLRAAFTATFPVTLVRQWQGDGNRRGRAMPLDGPRSTTRPSVLWQVAVPTPVTRERRTSRTIREIVRDRLVARSHVTRAWEEPRWSAGTRRRRERMAARPVGRAAEACASVRAIAAPSPVSPGVLIRAGRGAAAVRAPRLVHTAWTAAAPGRSTTRAREAPRRRDRDSDSDRPAPARLPMDVVRRGRAPKAGAGTAAFAAQALPLLLPPHPAPVAPEFPVERIERTLRESLTSATERTVQRELERTLRPGTPITRRLRESIQAEMCDDVVFERERRGGGRP